MSIEEKLIKAIEYYDKKYWEEGVSEIPDEEYDKLVRKLAEICPSHPLISKVHGKAGKVVHEKPMLSLGKAYSLEEVVAWAKKTSRSSSELFKVQPKYDGLSGKLEKGVLSSRGDGKTGEDYTSKLKLITLVGDFTKSTLGEMVISDKDFQWMTDNNVVSKSGKTLKNQRNGVVGVVCTDDEDFWMPTLEKMKAAGRSLVSLVNYESMSTTVTLKELQEKWSDLVEQVRSCGWPTDGVVVKLADEKYAEELGCTEHHPRGAIAFKFSNVSKWTKLIGVEWSMGKDQIAAVGLVEPTDLSGTTVKRVKLQLTKPVSSAVSSYLLDGSLQIGDDVLVERAGDVIPHVSASKPGAERIKVTLDKCPFCGAPIAISGAEVRCTSDDCNKKKQERLQYAMTALGFKGIGPSYAENLVNLLGVDSVLKLMTVSASDLRKHKEFGDKLVDIFIVEQKKAMSCSPETVLTAMDICGQVTARTLMKHMTPEELIFSSANRLKQINGIGDVVANEIASKASKKSNEILETLKLFNGESAAESVGEQVCFTGKMMKTRGEMEEIARKAGMQPVDTVKAGVRLVVADLSSTSSKMSKAKKLGCKIQTEEDFLAEVNG
jgi:DNA ligase (NAD+)